MEVGRDRKQIAREILELFLSCNMKVSDIKEVLTLNVAAVDTDEQYFINVQRLTALKIMFEGANERYSGLSIGDIQASYANWEHLNDMERIVLINNTANAVRWDGIMQTITDLPNPGACEEIYSNIKEKISSLRDVDQRFVMERE